MLNRKVQHFAEEDKTLDAARMQALEDERHIFIRQGQGVSWLIASTRLQRQLGAN